MAILPSDGQQRTEKGCQKPALQQKTTDVAHNHSCRVEILRNYIISIACSLIFLSSMKKRSEVCKHCALAVVRQSPIFLTQLQTPSGGHGTAKILSAGDGHHPCLQTQFGEERCTQFRVIVVTDPHHPPVRHIASLAHSVII